VLDRECRIDSCQNAKVVEAFEHDTRSRLFFELRTARPAQIPIECAAPTTYPFPRFRSLEILPCLYEASLEGARYQRPEEQEPFVDYLRSLFGGRDLDLIVAMGAPATFFVQRYRREFFPSTPMIIASTEQRGINSAALTANDTTVATTLDFRKWIESILEVLPQTEHIAWVVGGSPLERFWTQEFRRTANAFADRLTFEWFNDLTFEDMLKRVSSLPPRSAIYYVDLRMDAAGVPLEADRLARLHQVANAPIFSYVDSYLGQGIVGGPLLSSKELAASASAGGAGRAHVLREDLRPLQVRA
jgi:hypothetical protein